ncbi:MAG: membrane protein insertase YidC [Streptosporangiales bacterium]|nr:membrane protein insertase YidC [Streptosporangiales bacterium]
MDVSFDTFDWFYSGFAWVLIKIHAMWSMVFGPDSGLTWGLSIVVMTMLVRLLIFPLFVKQIRSQRAMSVLQPQMKELQAKYKDDKQKLQEEMMKLYKENGANPLSGCLPVLAQAPFLIAMYHVLNAISRHHVKYGLTQELVDSGSRAKIFGVPIGAIFREPERMAELGANVDLARVVIGILVVIMAVTTFIAQRQLMLKQTEQQKAAGQPTPFQQQQKIMLFIFPAMFLIWGFFFPMGLIVYWTTSNVWTMGQQFWVLHRIPHQPVENGKSTTAAKGAKTSGGSAATSKSGKSSGSANGKSSASDTKSGAPSNGSSRLFRRRKSEPEPEPAAPAPKVVRNQPTRVPRSKRSGAKKGTSSKKS